MENQKLNAPYALASLVLGICSILTSCFVVGLVCGIIGLVFANKGLTSYFSCPDTYEGSGLLRAGKITSIIGIIFSALSLLYLLLVGSVAAAWLGFLGSLI
jgi:hypothetical protein